MDSSLCSDFDGVSTTSLSGRVAAAVSRQQFTGIADPDHRNVDTHKAISSQEFMKGLACGGVENLYLENYDVVIQSFFKAYRDDHLDDDDLQALGQFYFGTSVEVDYGVDPQENRQTIIDYMKNAKKYEIDLRPVNELEGFFTEDEIQIIKDSKSGARDFLDEMFQNDSKFGALNPDEKIPYIGEKLSSLEDNSELKQSMVKHHGAVIIQQERTKDQISDYVEDGYSEDQAMDKVLLDIVAARLDKDDEVAERIKQEVGDEKTAIVYGREHFNRRFFDIDDTLGDSAVITVYGDKKWLETIFTTKDTTGVNWFYNEKEDYSLDAKTMTWQEGDKPPVQLDKPEELQSSDDVSIAPSSALNVSPIS